MGSFILSNYIFLISFISKCLFKTIMPIKNEPRQAVTNCVLKRFNRLSKGNNWKRALIKASTVL